MFNSQHIEEQVSERLADHNIIVSDFQLQRNEDPYKAAWELNMRFEFGENSARYFEQFHPDSGDEFVIKQCVDWALRASKTWGGRTA